MIYVKTMTDAYRLLHEMIALLESPDFDSYVTDLSIGITVTDDKGNSGVYETKVALHDGDLSIELEARERLLRGVGNK